MTKEKHIKTFKMNECGRVEVYEVEHRGERNLQLFVHDSGDGDGIRIFGHEIEMFIYHGQSLGFALNVKGKDKCTVAFIHGITAEGDSETFVLE